MTLEDAIFRLQAMLYPKQLTWDLSPNDVAAIEVVLVEVERLRGVIFRNCDPMDCTEEDSAIITTIMREERGD